jgi:hypothetical protein
MGLGLYFLVIYGLAFALLAIAILWCVPGLRVTFVNVLFFILGAFLGMIGITKAVMWGLEKGFGAGTVDKLLGHGPIVAYVVLFFGATAGGTTLVWLKILSMKAFQNRDNS